jgi:hypothetical protein
MIKSMFDVSALPGDCCMNCEVAAPSLIDIVTAAAL